MYGAEVFSAEKKEREEEDPLLPLTAVVFCKKDVLSASGKENPLCPA